MLSSSTHCSVQVNRIIMCLFGNALSHSDYLLLCFVFCQMVE
jgi:hypothetical protein